jgi:cytochrome c-type biogenesis protein CcmF
MIAEIGHFALALAVAVALIQILGPLAGGQLRGLSPTQRTQLMAVASPASVVQSALIFASFLALTYLYIVSDFSVQNVYANSHSAKPLIYRISGVWGNHEGSMVLWVLMVAAFGATVAVFGSHLPPSLKANVLAVQGAIGVAFLLFILFTSNPFLRIAEAPIEGQGLNPILQDPALAIHPPLLYAGYVGLSVSFSFAVAALIEGRIDAAWARWVRPWTLAAWMTLTLGISIGSWWAYYELGWGGWWFWDPVENASLMPWLLATALLHSAVVMEKREALKIWTILLAIMAFSLSLMGAFLVRSGVLTSVHAFAVDPARGTVMLGIMTFFVGGALSLFALRASSLKSGGIFAPISREGSLVLNNVLLTVACGTVLIGTLYPLGLEALTGAKISVGPPYFNATFGPLMVALLVALPYGPFLAWKRGDLYAASQRLMWAFAAAFAGMVLTLAIGGRGPWLAPLVMGLGLWVIVGAFAEIAHRAKLGSSSLSVAVQRMAGLPRSTWGTAFAHCGVGVMTVGIVAMSAFQSEKVLVMRIGEKAEIAGYTLTLKGVAPQRGPNYREEVGVLDVSRGGTPLLELTPSKRLYDAPRQSTSEAGIHVSWRGDLYAVLGDAQTDGGGGFTIRLYFNPLVRLIWIGTFIMFLGGMLSLTDRRLRVGAPQRARTRAQPVPAE